MLTVLEIIKRSAEFLARHEVENSRLNAELIIGHTLGLKRMQLYLQFERPLTETELEKIRPLVKRRSQREPLQYLLGTVEFCGLTLKVDRRALIPRPETELLVELARETFGAAAPARGLDLGTGTGAIALALAQTWSVAAVTAVERSPDALALARENAAATGLAERVRFLESDWFAALPREEKFELIISNPPYLTEAETEEAQPEVRDFEPRAALAAGAVGVDDLVKIIAGAPTYLSPDGWLMLETGIAQHVQLAECARTVGFAEIISRQDLTGRDRFLLMRR